MHFDKSIHHHHLYLEKLFDEIVNNNSHLLPPLNIPIRELRKQRRFRVNKCKTKRFQNDFIIRNALNYVILVTNIQQLFHEPELDMK